MLFQALELFEYQKAEAPLNFASIANENFVLQLFPIVVAHLPYRASGETV